MSKYCRFQRGFFVLRACDRPSMATCTKCGHAACNLHLSFNSNYSVCLECASSQKNFSHDYDHNDWLYSFRNTFYLHGYEPFTYGLRDYNSFDSRFEEGEDFDEDGADFLDS